MANYHLKDRRLSLKVKGLLSVMFEEKVPFDRFSDLMAKLMVKYSPDLLKRKKEELEKILLSSIDISPVLSTEAIYRRLKAYHSCVYQNNTGCNRKSA